MIENIVGWFIGTIDFLILNYGLFGLFFAAIIANATIILGVPIEIAIISLIAGTGWNPLVVGIIGGAGAAIGEMTGYLLGLGGHAALHKFDEKTAKKIHKIEKDINQKGPILVTVLAVAPFPFDLVGIASGLAKMHPGKFLIAAFIGKSIRYAIVGWAALVGMKIVLAFFGLAN